MQISCTWCYLDSAFPEHSIHSALPQYDALQVSLKGAFANHTSLCVETNNLQTDALQVSPDDEGLLLVALGGECNDVVAAAELGKGMTLWIPLQLNTSARLDAVYYACASRHASPSALLGFY